MKTGIILLSHGSRAPEAQITVRKLLSLVREGSGFDYVAGASLQFNQPDLPAALELAFASGVKKIIVVPLFLYMGLHMKKDIPEIIRAERQKYPGVQIIMTGNIGADRKLAEILLKRIGEVD